MYPVSPYQSSWILGSLSIGTKIETRPWYSHSNHHCCCQCLFLVLSWQAESWPLGWDRADAIAPDMSRASFGWIKKKYVSLMAFPMVYRMVLQWCSTAIVLQMLPSHWTQCEWSYRQSSGTDLCAQNEIFEMHRRALDQAARFLPFKMSEKRRFCRQCRVWKGSRNSPQLNNRRINRNLSFAGGWFLFLYDTNMILNTHHEKTVPFCSFFDLPRAAIIRDTPSVRLRKAAKGKWM